ncbi:DUF1850 domain-containing protein [Sedimentibacter sp. MB31-C6]|uniref:DUF1850 domain-containing protein n=1 Tax=Sedimentibacter sp. MB31-C6 TaxID=3109366 RepID=UPI002DDCBCA0|nr:DUF1850 domain-containing protein [Sedimentibacter sp. MB36-C1]WSI03405.1 DUF1850 domain-containing protein [Sedimentibacter sp. MB36-C1]
MNFSKSEFIIITIIFIIILSSIVFILGCNVENGKILVIQNNTTGIKTEFYLPNNSFSLGYTHSVMKTPAEEFFSVDENNQIILNKTVYESFGVGLPFLADEKDFEIKDDKFILYTNSIYNEINMIISPIPKHWLQIGDKKYELMDILKEPNCSIEIYVYDKDMIKKFFNISTDVFADIY